MIDLRSDTVTLPTPEMRRAMAEAPVGDDVFGEDPTVIELERLTADLLGKEAAMFVPSGTMANQVAVRLHAHSGDEMLLDPGSHVYNAEAGGVAALAGVTCRALPARRGIFTAAALEAAVRPPDVHNAPARLVWVENTHNVGGGSVWPLPALAEVSAAAKRRGLALHMDGARLWNAAAASGVAEREYAGLCDSVSVCYSKGRGAPVGSALAGPADFIERGRRFRKQFGGGMRQSGIIAAGALYALRHNRQRLTADHGNARRLAEGLAAVSGVELEFDRVESNIVRFRVAGSDARALAGRLKEQGLALMVTGPDSFRAMTHLAISAEDVDEAARVLAEVIDAAGRSPEPVAAPVGAT